MLKNKKIGFAMTGSFCTFKSVFAELEKLKETGCEIFPIMSETSFSTDTRFGTSIDMQSRFKEICGKDIIHTIAAAEPIGPRQLLDVLIIMPCTGNTLAKLAAGIADTSVTLAAKAHLRNQRPVLVAVSTNDGLANAAKNIGTLQNIKHYYFVPYRQDDFSGKPNSLVADFSMLIPAAEAALSGTQIQPVLV